MYVHVHRAFQPMFQRTPRKGYTLDAHPSKAVLYLVTHLGTSHDC